MRYHRLVAILLLVSAGCRSGAVTCTGLRWTTDWSVPQGSVAPSNTLGVDFSSTTSPFRGDLSLSSDGHVLAAIYVEFDVVNIPYILRGTLYGRSAPRVALVAPVSLGVSASSQTPEKSLGMVFSYGLGLAFRVHGHGGAVLAYRWHEWVSSSPSMQFHSITASYVRTY